MDVIDSTAVFLSVYECGSLTAAARQLQRSLQAVSRGLMALEEELGVQLILRTTRKCTPTEAGLAFYQRAKPAYAELREARLEAANRRVEPSGLLRIGASVQFAPVYVVPIVTAFMQRHPRVEVELALSDSFVDLADGHLDLALRIGELPDSELRARRLGALRRVIYAAPGYLQQNGVPERPEDLRQHQCVVRTATGSDARWPVLVNGRVRQIAVGGRLSANSTAAVTQAVAEGMGLGFAPYWQVRDLVQAGRLALVLTAYEVPPVPIHAVWQGQRHTPAKTRQFVDFLALQLKKRLRGV